MTYVRLYCSIERCIRYARYQSLETKSLYCSKHIKELQKKAKEIQFAEELLAEMRRNG